MAMIRLQTSSSDGTGARGAIERSDYLIDRFRVKYEFGGGWTCGCADFVARDACKHTREAAGRRTAQARIHDHVHNASPVAPSDTFALHKLAHDR
jgi:hypothetical protein